MVARGYVVRARKRPVSFSKRTDAADLFRALTILGVTYRQAELAVEALLGVDGRELRRGLASPIEPAGEDHVVLGAVFAIGKHIDLVMHRMESPSINAAQVVEDLPERARSWLKQQVIHFAPCASQGA